MTPIRTERLILRNWQERDRELFHTINSDDRVMEFFPFRRDRAAADALMDDLCADIDADGYGFAAIEIASTGECAGFAGLMETDLVPHLPAGAIEIGWRLAPEYWGKGIASEAAEAWLAHAFETLKLDEIVSYAVAINHRSTAVMRRIGMTLLEGAEFDHPAIPDSHPHLKRFVVYQLSQKHWLDRESQRRHPRA
jgi:RimJ/RimL family protein N-acetyltransferase